MEFIHSKPFLVAIAGGAGAQFIKVAFFLIVERRINYRRFVQADGAPNMHAAAFSALMVAVGLSDGFHSLAFAFSACLTAIILVDTMNVKNATSRQKEAVLLILDRVRSRPPSPEDRRPQLSYTPLDVLSGMGVGIFVALLIF